MKEDSPDTEPRTLSTAAFSVILLLGAILRVYAVARHEFWLDEVIQVDLVRRAENIWSLLKIVAESKVDASPPVSHLAVFLSTRLGEGELFARLPSVLAGLITVGLTYWVGVRWFGRQVAVAAAFLLAVSSLHVSYSQEARPYAMFALFSLMSAAFAFEMTKTEKRPVLLSSGFVASSVALCYTQFFGILVVAAEFVIVAIVTVREAWQGGAMLWRRVCRLQIPFLAVFAMIAPGVTVFLAKSESQVGHDLPGPTMDLDLLHDALLSLTGESHLWLVVCALLILASLLSGGSRKRPGRMWAAMIVLLTASATLLALKVGHRFFHARYLVELLPFIFLLTADGTARIATVFSRRRARVMIWTALAVAAVIGNHSSLSSHYETPKRPWRAVVKFLSEHALDGDIVLVDPPYLMYPVQYHMGSRKLWGLLANVDLDDRTLAIAPDFALENRATLSRSMRIWYLTDRTLVQLDRRSAELPAWVGTYHRRVGSFSGSEGRVDLYLNDRLD